MAKILYGEYGYTGAVRTITLPAGLYIFDLYGARGRGTYSGYGGYASGVLSLDTDTVINMYIGGGYNLGAGYVGGFNGGGNGASQYGQGGGGGTDIRIGGTSLADRVLVAGGGGGGNSGTSSGGGGGGGLAGINGTSGTGGTQTAGGSINGSLGQGGSGTRYSGGGGGGYYGGGGGSVNFTGGGGGSSYIKGANGYIPISSTTISAQNSGGGYINIYAIDSIDDYFPLNIQFGGSQVPLFLREGTYYCELYGSQGGNSGLGGFGGLGGKVAGNIELTTAETIYINVGGMNGYNGGGSGNSGSGSAYGGGATDIRIGGTSLADRILVAGGGGGTSTDGSDEAQGGIGGGLVGGNSRENYATGGTQTEGGYSNGALGQGGASANRGGGGGGGYYGGGGGVISYYYGGAGGSSYFGGTSNYPVTNGSTEAGVNTGNGYAIITLVPPSNSAAVNIQGQNNPIGLNLFTTTDTIQNSLRIGTTSGIKAFKLVDVNDFKASTVRVNTPDGMKAISKE